MNTWDLMGLAPAEWFEQGEWLPLYTGLWAVERGPGGEWVASYDVRTRKSFEGDRQGLLTLATFPDRGSLMKVTRGVSAGNYHSYKDLACSATSSN